MLPLIGAGLQEALQYIGEMTTVDNTEPDSWRHVVITWEHVGNIDPADRYVNTLDIANITNGAIDSTWNDADYTTVQTHVSSMVAVMLAQMSSQWRCKDVKYYRRFFNPLSVSAPFAPMGPPERTYINGTAGALGTAPLANQTAVSLTEKTAYPRHWGRTYWPAPTADKLIAASGHFTTLFTDAIGNGMRDQYALLQTAEFFPVVPVTQVQGAPVRGLLNVTSIQVDNVPDVIRRRRPHSTTYRNAGP